MAKQSPEIRILTNRFGSRVFSDPNELREFSKTTAQDLSYLTSVLTGYEEDLNFVLQSLNLVNDLAFQLHQAISLLFAEKSGDGMEVHS